VQLEGAGNDQAKLVDIDRLAVIIISAKRDRAQRAVVSAVAGGDDNLGVGFEAKDRLERRGPI